jgi:hypothetical protein
VNKQFTTWSRAHLPRAWRICDIDTNCYYTATWDAPPNFLLVDYYNYGDPKPGSVFEVAARYNNVTYNRPCCGSNYNAGVVSRASPMTVFAATVLIAIFLQQS